MGFPGRKITEAKCCFHDISKVHTVHVIITVEADLDRLAEGASGRFVHCKVSFPSFPRCLLWKEVTKRSPQLRSREWTTLRRLHCRRRSQGVGNPQQSEKKGLKAGLTGERRGD